MKNPSSAPGAELDTERYNALLKVADVVALRRDPGELLTDLAPKLRAVVPFNLVNFSLLDSARKTVEMFLWEGEEWPHEPLEIGVEETAVGSVWRNQTALSIDDLSTERRFEAEVRRLRERKIRSYCVVPLTSLNEKLGAIGFGSERASAFGSSDVEFLDRVARMLALNVDDTLPEETLAEETARLRLLLEVSAPRLQGCDVEHSVAAILESLQKWAVEDYVGLYLYDETAQALRLHMADPHAAEKLSVQGLTPIEGTLAGRAFRSQRSVVLDYVELAGMSLTSVRRGLELGVKSLYLTPIVSERGPLGVLKLARRGDQPFSRRDLELLEQVAARVVPAFERGVAAGEIQKAGDATQVTPNVGRMLNAIGTAPLADWAQRLATGSAKEGATKAFGAFPLPEILSEWEQLLAAFFDASNVGLCLLDKNFRYLAINHTLAEMNGLGVEAHWGKSVREVLGDFAELVEPQFTRVLETKQPILNLQISSILPTRTEPGHWIEHYIPIKNAVGEVVQIGVVAVEVTEQRNLEESLRGVSEKLREEKKRQQVMMEVSHVLAAKWDARQVFPKISAYLRRVLRQEYAALAVHDEKTGQLVRQAIDFPLRKGPAADTEINPAKDPRGKALRERAPLIFTKSEIQEFPPGTADHLLAEGLQSLCCVPLIRPKGPLGMLVLGSTRANAFKTDDLTLLEQVAAQLAIAVENARAAREVEQLRNRLEQDKRHLEGEPRIQLHFEEIIGESPALQVVLDQVTVVAASDATVLLLGETGTGKGLIARAIHRISNRKDRSFVTLNCAAIPTGLLESELFGHEKGAFTGAVSQKVGRLEMADKGTLFLDEIGEIPLELQPKLLRVLQDHEFERLGGTRTIKVDLRLLAATNRDLARSVSEQEFRSDLFYRLNVFPIRMPSLRERREDIALLVRYFIRHFARGMNRVIETVPSETMDALINWHWPGNVRELENFIERSVILSDGAALQAPVAELHAETFADLSLESTEREHIIRVLGETGGTISGPTGAAHRLGLKRTTLQSKMRRLGITPQDYSGKERA